MFIALLDTSVLWPSLQRDFILSLAAERMYRPVWSAAILAELERHEELKLVKYGVDEVDARERAARLVFTMRSAFADAEVTGWGPLEGTFGLPDPDDEHVVAAARIANADVIVTENLKDFPSRCLPEGIGAIPAREFVADTVELSPDAAITALTELSRRSGRLGPALSVGELIDILEDCYRMTDAMAVVRHRLAATSPHHGTVSPR